VPVDDRLADAEGVAKVADGVAAELEAPARRIAPLGAAVSRQIEIDDLRHLRESGEVGREVRVIEAPGPTVQQHDGGSLAHRRPLGHERGAVDVEPQAAPIDLDLQRSLPFVRSALF
jgi:hypothetical protein